MKVRVALRVGAGTVSGCASRRIVPRLTVTPESTPESRKFLAQFQNELAVATDPEVSNAFTGKALLILNRVCGMTLERAWPMVRPRSTATGESARQLAYKRIKHYLAKHPQVINEALEISGITIQRLTDLCSDMLEARRWAGDPDAGTLVKTDAPDWSVRDKALGRILQLLELDKRVREQAVLGEQDQNKKQLNTPPEHASVQEWEDWASAREQGTMKKRTRAAQEMKLIAEGRRIIRERRRRSRPKDARTSESRQSG